MEKKDGHQEATSSNSRKLTNFNGTDLLTLGNAFNRAAQEIKGVGLGYRHVGRTDIEAFITKTDNFLRVMIKAWEAIKLAIKEDRDDLNLYEILDDRTEEEKALFNQMYNIERPIEKI
jgi:hypothetical protein